MNVRDLQAVASLLAKHGADNLTLRQVAVLIALDQATDDGVDFTALRESVGLSKAKKPAITRAMDTLGHIGFAVRRVTNEDKRRRVCAITPKGREVVKSLGEAA